jgi:hypothetical protein
MARTWNLLLLILLALPIQAADFFSGTWQLNPAVATSTFGRDAIPKAGTLTIELERSTLTLKGTVKTEKDEERSVASAYRLDGKEREEQGVAITARRLNDNTVQIVFRGANDLVSRRTMIVSPNGKMMTSVTVGTNAGGQDFATYLLYDRQ